MTRSDGVVYFNERLNFWTKLRIEYEKSPEENKKSFIQQGINNFNEGNIDESIVTQGDTSLLYYLCSFPLTNFSNEILIRIIGDENEKINLENRGDLLEILIKDHNISSDPDTSKLFDIMVKKGIPIPDSEVIKEIATHDRSRSGNNAAKLAKSFVLYRENYDFLAEGSIESAIIEYESEQRKLKGTPRSNKGSGPITLDSVNLKELLSNKLNNSEEFKNALIALIKLKDDSYINRAIKNKNNKNLIPTIENHAEILNVAIDYKFSQTFKNLINAGFNPNRTNSNKPNSISYACSKQSATILKHYFSALEDDMLFNLLNIDSQGKSAIDYAIEGKSYISTITLLHSLKCDLEYNLENRLEKIIDNNHSDTLDFFLKNTKISENQQLLNKIILAANSKEDNRVLSNVILHFITSNQLGNNVDNEQLEILSKKVSNEDNRFHNLETKDLYIVCKMSAKNTLLFYLEQRIREDENFNFSEEVNKYDNENKTPLYYAIANNSYNDLVEELVNQGANIRNIGFDEKGEVIDGLDLIIKNQEYSTLKLVLNHDTCNNDYRNHIFNKILNPENNNYILHKTFLENVSTDYLLSKQELFDKLCHRFIEGSNLSLIEILFSKNQNNYQNSLFESDSYDLLEHAINVFSDKSSEESEEVIKFILQKAIIPKEDQRVFLKDKGFLPKGICETVIDYLQSCFQNRNDYNQIR